MFWWGVLAWAVWVGCVGLLALRLLGWYGSRPVKACPEESKR